MPPDSLEGPKTIFGGYFEAPKTLNSSHGHVLRPPEINFLTMRTFDNRFQLQQTLTQSPKLRCAYEIVKNKIFLENTQML